MPRLSGNTSLQVHRLGGNFTFSGARIDDLGATEYTLVTIAVDLSSSTGPFATELRDMLVMAVDSCKRSPRSDNLLLRAITFSTSGGVVELHGYIPLSEIDVSNYPAFRPSGMTPLCDAAYSAIGSMVSYGKKLMDSDYLTNGIVFVITDGVENASSTTVDMVKQELESVEKNESLESIISVLVGINAQYCAQELQYFQIAAGIDEYIDAGEATKEKLAKLAAFVSQSVSSQSQALGTGGPSQNISATI